MLAVVDMKSHDCGSSTLDERVGGTIRLAQPQKGLALEAPEFGRRRRNNRSIGRPRPLHACTSSPRLNMALKPSRKAVDATAHLGLEQKVWLAADKLRSDMDVAGYKRVVPWPICLKYVSDRFEEHRARLAAGQGEFEGADPEDNYEYLAGKVFWVVAIAVYGQESYPTTPRLAIMNLALCGIEADARRHLQPRSPSRLPCRQRDAPKRETRTAKPLGGWFAKRMTTARQSALHRPWLVLQGKRAPAEEPSNTRRRTMSAASRNACELN